MSLDPTESLLWVATKRMLFGVDEAGSVMETIDLGKKADIVDLELDHISGNLWVGLKDALLILNSTGEPVYERSWKDLCQLAADGQGGAWVATRKELAHLDALTEMLAEVSPEGQGVLGNLVCNHADASAWVSSQTVVYRVDSGGEITHTLEFEGPVVRDLELAIYADLIPPVLSFQAPTERALLNTNTPTLELAYDDIGMGVDPETLQMGIRPKAVEVIIAKIVYFLIGFILFCKQSL